MGTINTALILIQLVISLYCVLTALFDTGQVQQEELCSLTAVGTV